MRRQKRRKRIKNFFEEFKKFITRGNVLDMAVGVIVGGAFTAIVNGLSNFVLKPIINWILALIIGKDGLAGAITMLSPAYSLAEDGSILLDANGAKVIDLANSIYIDWGAFISAIINFLLIAFVLFSIVRVLNRISDAREKMEEHPEWNKKKEVARIRYEKRVSKKEAIAIWEAECEAAKAKAEEEKRLAEEKAAEEKRIAEEKATANTRLLEEIRDLLKQK
ncbi:MAG: MscL family protein [Clostridiales bacterium]|nr:MscL family protein [Clostridiales bacterium]